MKDIKGIAQAELDFWPSFQQINQAMPHLMPYADIHRAFGETYQGGAFVSMDK
ncbi:hypothetical protein [Moraxella catarrhalis]|uniref:hypothetical protein n=1 Tax=Moraxella catarrhalis TaxID=480 RepID=UPI000AFF7BD6|nr:hypothetical protein [Moraxella catarrhalis]AZQ87003.1 hypothetical protein EJK52_1836 [Moraxella catarrhalis]AZQ90679.1 hypothetical protein EJK51_1837 [Moraxella catarrhalis]